MPQSKSKPAFCVYDSVKDSTVWVSCPHVDYLALQKEIIEYGLNEAAIEFSRSLYSLDGDGTTTSMKMLNASDSVKVVSAKVM